MSYLHLVRIFSKQHKYKLLLSSIFLFLLISIAAYFYLQKINFFITQEKNKEILSNKIEITMRLMTKLNSTGVRLLVEAKEAKNICRYKDNYYVATSGGLLVLDKEGKLVNHYTILDGLPSLNLLTLVVFRGQLYIGTADNGLVAFNGKDFSHYQIEKPSIKQINTLLATEGGLLVGSFDGGLLNFDGTKFTHRDKDIKPIPQITSLLEHENRLYVGTYASGLYIWQEGRWQQLQKEQGLPSNRVTALIKDKQGAVIATDLGIVLRTTDGSFEQINKTVNVTSLARFQDTLLGGLLTGGMVDLSNKLPNTSLISGTPNKEDLYNQEMQMQGNTILWMNEEESLFALTKNGIFHNQTDRTRLKFEPFGALPTQSLLTTSHISSMAFDERGRLWLGYFDQGIDVFDPVNMQLITHLKDQNIREINFISLEKRTSKMLVATSAGLAIFDSQLQYRLLTEKDGLNSNSVAQVSVIPGANSNLNGFQMAIATGKGLTLLNGTLARSPISLPNNYLYTTDIVNNHLFLGSLGGLIEMEGLKVVRNFNISNSKLSHNWINSLLNVNGTLYIGTNGGGVDALTPTGEFINFFPEIGKFDVNPNAMFADEQYLYVGSLDRGVFLFNLKTKIWKNFTQILPSLNVTAILSDDQHVYFATNNGLIRIEKKINLVN